MDVTCDNCKAEYDFDDTLLGDKGTTVKCSKCGHVFRVMPPRREPTRSALKVRFRDGRIESVASLRDLQQRIQAGQVGMDDELGRDGFTYRRLGDVPELRNFFTRSVPASGPVSSAALQSARNDLPHRGEPIPAKAAPKRTVLGMGGPDIPAAPRVPNFGPVAAAQALAPTQPAAEAPKTPKGTIQGRAPISSAPTAPNMAIPPRDAQRPGQEPLARGPVRFDEALISSAPTPTERSAPTTTDSAPTQPPPTTQVAPAAHGALAPSPSGTAPTQISPASSVFATGPTIDARFALDGTPVRPVSGSAAPVAQRPAGPALRISESAMEGPMRSDGPTPPRSPALDSVPPGALKAATQPKSGTPRGGSGGAVRLSVDEEDRLHERQRAGGGSRWLLYLVAGALLAGGGFVIARQLSQNPVQATPPLAAAPAEAPATPPPTPAVGADAAALTGSTPAPEQAPEAKPEETSKAAAPAPTPASEPSAKPTAKAPEPSREKPADKAPSADRGKDKDKPSANESSGGSAREPKDYAGWVSRGDQLLAKKDLAGAQQAFQTAVSLRGTGSEANSGLGAALLAQGQTREAIPYLTRAASNGFAEASVNLGDAYRKLGDKDSAIESYETYLARLPRGARANYVKLQLEGLGKDMGGAKSEPAPAREESRPSAPPSEYRPAGEMTEPPSAPAENPQ